MPVLLRIVSLLALSFLSCAVGADEGRTHSGYYTPARFQTARANAEQLAWARAIRDDAVANAKPWVSHSDVSLWNMVPGQDLPRCISVTLTRGANATTSTGCLSCGDRINRFGDYPYEPDFDGKPWKLTCPSCGAVFPTNDFGDYYRSGIDAQGWFNPAKADRRLLFNSAHPDPQDPLHLFGVDDGYGTIDANGHAHRFIGYYAWKYWRHIIDGVQALGNAYVLTGDRGYAHKAAILLDRIADAYPNIDWAPYAALGWYHSDGNRGVGKIEGAIWETNVARKLAESYDAILSGTVGDSALFDFLAKRSRRYHLPTPKGNRALFIQNVDERILRCIHDAILSGQIHGNEGMQQMAMASSALALNTAPETAQWLDWLFEPTGGALPGLIVDLMDRDGASDEGAPGYTQLAGQLLGRLAIRLQDYAAYNRSDLLDAFPRLRKSLSLSYRMATLGEVIPNLGDQGATGLRIKPSPTYSDLGFQSTGDPELAVAAWRSNGNKSEGLGQNILLPNPDGIAYEMESIAQTAGPRPIGGHLLSGFGLATLEVGEPGHGFGLVLNYGRTYHHAHLDMLNFDLFGFGQWLAPDLGYPEFATKWPHSSEWTRNTIAHNTVVVEGTPQTPVYSGHINLFRQLPGFGVMEIDGREAYPMLEKYQRFMALVQAPDKTNAYVVDIFTVKGGSDHVYSFHGPPGEVTTDLPHLIAQVGGTYAGAGINYGAAPGDFPVGYSYLDDVQRAQNPPDISYVDWSMEAGYRGSKANDKTHVRFHSLTHVDEFTLAHGHPPQNKEGNPRCIGYLLAQRHGRELASTFVSIIEPYRVTPFIRDITRLITDDKSQVALRITFTDGSEDTLLWSDDGRGNSLITGIATLHGKLGYVRHRADGSERHILIGGTRLRAGKSTLISPGELSGRVVKMNREIKGGGWLWVDSPLPLDGSLIGLKIHIANDNERDACYPIESVEHDGDLTKIYCGRVSFIRGFKSPLINMRGQLLRASYDHGYLYDFEVGARFHIVLHVDQ